MEVNHLGRTIKGHVLDLDKDYMESILKRYDSLLYLKWNPKKRGGYGVWEVRRRPEHKVPVFKSMGLDGNKIYSLEYLENDMIHHIMDAPILDMRIMQRLYEMDTTRVDSKSWCAEMEYRAEKRQQELENRYSQELRYMIRDNKKYYSQLKEYVQAGYNPAWFFSSHRK